MDLLPMKMREAPRRKPQKSVLVLIMAGKDETPQNDQQRVQAPESGHSSGNNGNPQGPEHTPPLNPQPSNGTVQREPVPLLQVDDVDPFTLSFSELRKKFQQG